MHVCKLIHSDLTIATETNASGPIHPVDVLRYFVRDKRESLTLQIQRQGVEISDGMSWVKSCIIKHCNALIPTSFNRPYS